MINLTLDDITQMVWKYWNFKTACRSKFSRTEEAKKNRQLKDKYKGRRCFIVGNGPSILDQNLKLLENEIVFVANEFWRTGKYREVKPDYYLFFDSFYFNQGSAHYLMEEFNEFLCKNEHRPEFIVPLTAKEVVLKCFEWEKYMVYYLDKSLSFTDGYSREYDITKPIPGVQNVVQYAILLATYMGFKEVYMLGVEETNLLSLVESYIKNESISRYAYEVERDNPLKKMENNLLQEQTLESRLESFARMFHLYREVYSFCQRGGVKVYNCTPSSLVDSIPKKKYETLFDETFLH